MKTFKVILLGEGRVGKSSMLKQIMKGTFEEGEQTTTKASNYKKSVTVDKTTVLLDLWDTAGQEQYHALGPAYYRDADAAIVVYDVSIPETFYMVKKWIEEMSVICNRDIVYVIVGNKTDLVTDYDSREARLFAASINGSYIETSAKTGQNLNLMLENVTRNLLEHTLEDRLEGGGYNSPLLVCDETEKRCCCCK